MYKLADLDEDELISLVEDVSATIRRLDRLRDRIKGTSLPETHPRWAECAVLARHVQSLVTVAEHCAHHLTTMCGIPVKDDANGSEAGRRQGRDPNR